MLVNVLFNENIQKDRTFIKIFRVDNRKLGSIYWKCCFDIITILFESYDTIVSANRQLDRENPSSVSSMLH
jgi:hypothetical protein